MKNVRIIPAKLKENKKLKVAAYCRVSTSGPEQMRSLEIQISAYKKIIKSYSNWIFTKSISRVSRDTLEVLKITRFLRERGINKNSFPIIKYL